MIYIGTGPRRGGEKVYLSVSYNLIVNQRETTKNKLFEVTQTSCRKSQIAKFSFGINTDKKSLYFYFDLMSTIRNAYLQYNPTSLTWPYCSDTL